MKKKLSQLNSTHFDIHRNEKEFHEIFLIHIRNFVYDLPTHLPRDVDAMHIQLHSNECE